jgi:hypothetical protein
MAMKNTTVNAIVRLGWVYDLHMYGGWSHYDVRDDDGERIVFDSARDVAKHIGLETAP